MNDSPYAVLQNRDFRLYLISRFVASFGQQMLTVAVGWELYERTHSALALGMVGLAQMIPMLLFTLPAGHLADHLPHRLELGEELVDLLNAYAAALGYSALAAAVQHPRIGPLVRGHRADHRFVAGELLLVHIHVFELAHARQHAEDLIQRTHPAHLLKLIQEIVQIEPVFTQALLELRRLLLIDRLLGLLYQR